MFKSKKADFPPRPDPPTWEEMEEDLKKAANTDIVFNYGLLTTDEQRRLSSTESEAAVRDNLHNDELLHKAIDFVEKNDELVSKMKLLNEEKEKLQEVSNNLKTTVQEVKKRALGAIDGY